MSDIVLLKPRQQIALSALLTGANIEQAARTASVDPRTVRRWMQEDDFRSSLDRAQADLARQAARRLTSLLHDSVDELGVLLKKTDLPPLDRLRVIQTVLNIYPRIHESVTIEGRLDQIERTLNE